MALALLRSPAELARAARIVALSKRAVRDCSRDKAPPECLAPPSLFPPPPRRRPRRLLMSRREYARCKGGRPFGCPTVRCAREKNLTIEIVAAGFLVDSTAKLSSKYKHIIIVFVYTYIYEHFCPLK